MNPVSYLQEKFFQQTLTKLLIINSLSPQPDLQKREAA
jgi:hypothetical protein